MCFKNNVFQLMQDLMIFHGSNWCMLQNAHWEFAAVLHINASLLFPISLSSRLHWEPPQSFAQIQGRNYSDFRM